MQEQTKKKIIIQIPKGRPLLKWVGKTPLDYVEGHPTQLVEYYAPDKKTKVLKVPEYDELEKSWHNLLFHGDNKEVLATLLELGFRDKVDLILDFNTVHYIKILLDEVFGQDNFTNEVKPPRAKARGTSDVPGLPLGGGTPACRQAGRTVRLRRTGAWVRIKIASFISPTIIKRLELEPGLLQKKILDFRSMIDVVLVDANYDGEVFKIGFSDVPEKRDDLVKGEYELEISEEPTKVAVKVIDMLGEEVLVTREV